MDTGKLFNIFCIKYTCRILTCTMQVHLQTQQSGNIGLLKMGVKVFRSDGAMGLYNGLSASLLRQVS